LAWEFVDMNEDLFAMGLWWVPDGDRLRNATPGECCAEIKRLTSALERIVAIDGATDSNGTAHQIMVAQLIAIEALRK
jgi:hypothetical protein